MTTRPISRASGTFQLEHPKLGPLAELPGTWIGTGFNLIGRPDFKNPPFFLELNGTLETLEFNLIGGDIPNRGSAQPDINVHGLHYLQKVADCQTHGALHIEPGLWIHVPKTEEPPVHEETVVRQSTIPHGDSLLAQSTFLKRVAGGPVLNPVFSNPFTDDVTPGLNDAAKEPLGLPYLLPYTTETVPPCCLPAGTDPHAVVLNPVLALAAAIQGLKIVETQVIQVSTSAVLGSTGILNIPFVLKNANATQMDAIFWIETVKPDEGEPFLQLQYVQRVILDFAVDPVNGKRIHWPHISVATLVKQ